MITGELTIKSIQNSETQIKMEKHLRQRIEEVTEQLNQLTDPDWVAWGLITRAALHKESGDQQAALADLSTAIELPDIPVEKLEDALRERSWIKLCNNQYAAALMDIEQLMLAPGMPPYRARFTNLQRLEIIRTARRAGVILNSSIIH